MACAFCDIVLSMQWAADAAVLRPPEEEAEPWSAPQTAVPPEAPAQGEERGSPHGETRGGEDSPEGHGHPAWDGRVHGWSVQRQDFQPGWN